jgi:AcrR family transcriptional regulator
MKHASRGRPRSFDREAALDRAMLVFWRHGYEATSLAQLTAAMGVSPPSLYAAFGDKEKLFLETVERYRARGTDDVLRLMADAASAKDAVERVMLGTAAALTDPRYPRGCMVVLAAVSCSDQAADVQAKLAAYRALSEKQLRQRIEKGIADGDVPASASAAALASFYMAVLEGMSLQAKDGASRKRLEEIGIAALDAWPTKARRTKR